MQLQALMPLAVLITVTPSISAAPLPFNYKVETYRDEEGEVMVFALRLEQPFLAEEFEKSNFLRLEPLDRNAYLIYPTETKFHQKHAEFYGRLRGAGKAKVRLSYEIVSENLDGTRKVDVRAADIDIAVPSAEGGPERIFQQWAREQNTHFASLLSFYPDETFFQYVLLQSRDRYGVTPPSFRKPMPSSDEIETSLYHTFGAGLTMQKSLQRQALARRPTVGDLNIHVSELVPPAIKSHPYSALLERKLEKEGIRPRVHAAAKLAPADQYFLHFNSVGAAREVMELSSLWGNTLVRLFSLHGREPHLRQKFEDQLCLKLDSLDRLFADVAVSELVVTGSDIFVAEGADLTIILRLAKPNVFQTAAEGWMRDVRRRYPQLREREFNYRGHRVAARYTSDRMVSSFVVRTGEYAVYSNSHRVIRKIVDTAIGASPSLYDSLDYRYITTILPPSKDARSGYFFASEQFLRGLVSPTLKISEKRRLQCFNNLVMLNNASLFYRLEHRKSPAALTGLIEGRFVNVSKLVCPHGGAYALDAERDTCTCSLHNRIKYLTPNVELEILNVSSAEQREYDRYKKRYASLWKKVFDPLAVRITVDPQLKLEVALLPFLNSTLYDDLRGWLAKTPRPLGTATVARSAVTSLLAVPGRQKVGKVLRQIPGVPEALEVDPTLTDLSWIGDRVSFHLCDEDTVLEIDPTRLRPLSALGEISLMQQSLVAMALTATSLPLYIAIDVEDITKADRLLKKLTSKIFLKGGDFLSLRTALDAYQLPDYREHEIFVLSYQIYALKVRLYVSLVGHQLVAATRLGTLRDVVDARGREEPRAPEPAHMLLRLNRRALHELKADLEIYWAERSRQACHANIMSIYNLVKLYEVGVGDVDKLSDAKYGVTYFCPDGGTYSHDTKRDQVRCDLHGNRQQARQNEPREGGSSFSRFINSFDEIVTRLRFRDDSLIATVELERKAEK